MLFSLVSSPGGGTEWRAVCTTAVPENSASSLRTLQQSGRSFTQELESVSYSREPVSPLTAPQSTRLCVCSHKNRGSRVMQQDSYVNIFVSENNFPPQSVSLQDDEKIPPSRWSYYFGLKMAVHQIYNGFLNT